MKSCMIRELERKKIECMGEYALKNVHHYAIGRNNIDRGCYPYREDASLLKQMFTYLSVWNPPSETNEAASDKHFPK